MLEGHACSMTTEPRTPDDLAWRATAHAALSDLGRLRVIDSLEVADVSPRDLAVSLGMSSNLLAHHLKVLESAGLVRRLPSESDGRRTYVRLVPEALARLGTFPTPALPDGRVVFVCSGNSARSQLAAAVWAQRTGRPPDRPGPDRLRASIQGRSGWRDPTGCSCSLTGRAPRARFSGPTTCSSRCATPLIARSTGRTGTGRSRTRSGSARVPPSSARSPISPPGSTAGSRRPRRRGRRLPAVAGPGIRPGRSR